MNIRERVLTPLLQGLPAEALAPVPARTRERALVAILAGWGERARTRIEEMRLAYPQEDMGVVRQAGIARDQTFPDIDAHSESRRNAYHEWMATWNARSNPSESKAAQARCLRRALLGIENIEGIEERIRDAGIANAQHEPDAALVGETATTLIAEVTTPTPANESERESRARRINSLTKLVGLELKLAMRLYDTEYESVLSEETRATIDAIEREGSVPWPKDATERTLADVAALVGTTPYDRGRTINGKLEERFSSNDRRGEGNTRPIANDAFEAYVDANPLVIPVFDPIENEVGEATPSTWLMRHYESAGRTVWIGYDSERGEPVAVEGPWNEITGSQPLSEVKAEPEPGRPVFVRVHPMFNEGTGARRSVKSVEELESGKHPFEIYGTRHASDTPNAHALVLAAAACMGGNRRVVMFRSEGKQQHDFQPIPEEEYRAAVSHPVLGTMAWLAWGGHQVHLVAGPLAEPGIDPATAKIDRIERDHVREVLADRSMSDNEAQGRFFADIVRAVDSELSYPGRNFQKAAKPRHGPRDPVITFRWSKEPHRPWQTLRVGWIADNRPFAGDEGRERLGRVFSSLREICEAREGHARIDLLVPTDTVRDPAQWNPFIEAVHDYNRAESGYTKRETQIRVREENDLSSAPLACTIVANLDAANPEHHRLYDMVARAAAHPHAPLVAVDHLPVGMIPGQVCLWGTPAARSRRWNVRQGELLTAISTTAEAIAAYVNPAKHDRIGAFLVERVPSIVPSGASEAEEKARRIGLQEAVKAGCTHAKKACELKPAKRDTQAAARLRERQEQGLQAPFEHLGEMMDAGR